MSWTEVDKQKKIGPEEVENGPYPEPNKNVLVTVESDFSDDDREVLASSLNPNVFTDTYEWLQADGPAKVIAWKPMPDPYDP